MKERIYKHRNPKKRREDMRQKYVISRDDTKNKLKIREYAILDKSLNKFDSSMLQEEIFHFSAKKFMKVRLS